MTKRGVAGARRENDAEIRKEFEGEVAQLRNILGPQIALLERLDTLNAEQGVNANPENVKRADELRTEINSAMQRVVTNPEYLRVFPFLRGVSPMVVLTPEFYRATTELRNREAWFTLLKEKLTGPTEEFTRFISTAGPDAIELILEGLNDPRLAAFVTGAQAAAMTLMTAEQAAQVIMNQGAGVPPATAKLALQLALLIS